MSTIVPVRIQRLDVAQLLQIILVEVKQISGRTWDAISTQLRSKEAGGIDVSADMLRQYAICKKKVSTKRMLTLAIAAKRSQWAGPKTNKILKNQEKASREISWFADPKFIKLNARINRHQLMAKRARAIATQRLESAVLEMLQCGCNESEIRAITIAALEALAPAFEAD